MTSRAESPGAGKLRALSTSHSIRPRFFRASAVTVSRRPPAHRPCQVIRVCVESVEKPAPFLNRARITGLRRRTVTFESLSIPPGVTMRTAEVSTARFTVPLSLPVPVAVSVRTLPLDAMLFVLKVTSISSWVLPGKYTVDWTVHPPSSPVTEQLRL